MTTSDPLLGRLDGDGVQVTIGPFLVRVRSELDGVRTYLERLYSGFPLHAGIDGHFDIAVVGGRGLHRWIRPQAAVVINGATPFFPLPATLAGGLLEWGLNWCVGRNAHRWVVLHAAVVERGGRALILPAPPGSGKSTLCAALAYSGWRLFSDEFAILDPATGLVRALPRPISLKERSLDVIAARHPDVVFGPEGRDVEGVRFAHARPPADSVARAQEPAIPAWVITPRYVPGSRTVLTPMPKAEALVSLADQSFNYNYVATGYQCLRELIRGVDCYSLEYSDVDDVLARLGQLAAHQ
ncbi:MAG: HprK-related kinase A [Acidobacteriota bacterium]